MSIDTTLLHPRYLVIADDTSGNWTVGDILLFKECKYGFYHERWNGSQIEIWYEDYKPMPRNSFVTFPHLFRKLEWHEMRSVEEMPEYVRSKTRPNKVMKFSDISEWQYSLYEPSTEADYTQYINTNK